MEPRIRYVTTHDGVSIAFWTLGEGTPLVYMVGGPWSHVELWDIPECRRWCERLARERTLVRYDVRGTSLSERQATDYSLDALVLDLEAVMDRLGFERFALLGAADAGPVAMTYAARHPERVSHLILWCSWARTSDIQSSRFRAWRGLLDQDWELMTDTCAHLALGWSAGEVGRRAAERLRDSTSPEAMRAALAAMDGVDVRPRLREIMAPTLVLYRDSISWLSIDIARDLTSQIPDARMTVLEGESTAPFLGDSELAATAIDEFLSTALTASPGEDVRGPTGHRDASTFTSQRSGSGLARDFPAGLTPREVEVLGHLAGGKTNSEIADELFVSVRTVERHVANIYAKIGARGRANATAYALIHGLV